MIVAQEACVAAGMRHGRSNAFIIRAALRLATCAIDIKSI
jgi:hypothetical protein